MYRIISISASNNLVNGSNVEHPMVMN